MSLDSDNLGLTGHDAFSGLLDYFADNYAAKALLVDVHGQVKWASNGLADQLQFSVEEICRSNLCDLIGFDKRANWEQWEAKLTDQSMLTIQLQAQNDTLISVPFCVYVLPPHVYSGEAAYLLSSKHDEFYQNFLDGFHAAALMVDTKGQIIWANEHAKQLPLNVSMVGSSFSALVEENDQLAEVFKQLDAGEVNVDYEASFGLKDGKCIAYEFNAKQLSLPNGQTVYCFLGFQSSQHAEAEMNQAERLDLLKNSANIAKVGAFKFEVESERLLVSQQLKSMLSLPAGSQINELDMLLAYVCESDKDKFAKAIDHAIKFGLHWQLDLELSNHEGYQKHFKSIGRVERDEEGQSKHIHVVFQDISFQKSIQEDNRMLAMLARHTSSACAISDAADEIVWINQAYTRMTGYELHEVVGVSIHNLLDGPLTDPEAITRMKQQVEKGEGYKETLVSYTKAGDVFWLDVSTQPVFGENGEIEKWVQVNHDVTQKIKDEKRLHDTMARFEAVYLQSPVGIAILDLAGRYVQINEAFHDMYGLSRDEMINHHMNDFTHEEDRPHEQALFSQLISNEINKYEVVQRESIGDTKWHGDKNYMWVKSVLTIVHDQDGEPEFVALIQMDLTEQKDLETALTHQAFYDPLTDLPNRNYFFNQLHEQTNNVLHGKLNGFALLLVDLDDFNSINDSLGHFYGDRLLRIVGERLRNSVRETDIVARIAGDVFAILVKHDTTEQDAMRTADQIHHEFEETIRFQNQRLFLSVGLGIAVYSGEDDLNVDQLFRNADAALHQAKKAGSRQTAFSSIEMREKTANTLRIKNDLKEAIEQDQFELYYQPIVNLDTGQIKAVEALIRWHHPENGFVSPGEFIPVAESTGLVVGIGDWVLREATRQIMSWEANYDLPEQFHVQVNISSQHIDQYGFATHVAQLLDHANVNPNRLVVELTETTLVSNVKVTSEALYELNDIGVPIAIDDFGTGYSSLSQLHHLSIDQMKIDRSFIRDIGVEMDDKHEQVKDIVRTIVSLGHGLDISITAEGIENLEQMAYLKELGVSYAQGFYFAKPMPASDLVEFFKQPNCCPVSL